MITKTNLKKTIIVNNIEDLDDDMQENLLADRKK